MIRDFDSNQDASNLRGNQRHFDGIAEGYYAIVDRVWYEYGYFHTRERAFLSDCLAAKQGLAIDAGCGPGRNTLTLASIAKRVIAVDLSRKMLETARGSALHGAANVDLVQADVRRLPLKSGMADIAVNLEVLEHLPGKLLGISDALHELRRVLRQGGELVTEAPLWVHVYLNLICQPSMKELKSDEIRRYYENDPLAVGDVERAGQIEKLLGATDFVVTKTAFVRVLPSGLVERLPALSKLDTILERSPLARWLAREAIWLARAV